MTRRTRSPFAQHPGPVRPSRTSRRATCTFAAALVLMAVTAPVTGQQYDVLIRGGTVVDGTGAPRFEADVAITDGRIVSVAPEGIDPSQARRVIDATGQIVSPGFIDNHAHVQQSIAQYPIAENFLRQGITTLIASLHSGDQPWPLEPFASSLETAPNVGFFAGHTWTRKQVLGMENRDPTPDELEEMKALVDETMRQGALGLSTGLLYVPANFAKTEEVIELAKVASAHGGIYVSHMRNEASGLLDSVREVIRIADEASIPAQINHHKAAGAAQWGWSERSLALIDSANAAGLTVVHDLYPYTASSTGSSILFPQWALAGGPEGFAERVADPETRARMEEDMRRIFTTDRVGSDISRIQFRVLRSDESYNGKTLADYAADRGLPNDLETGIDLAIELQLAGGFSAIYHAMEEEDVIRIMQHPLAMIETDGDAVGYGIGYPHPRSYGAFARVLGRYVRELEVLTLEEAVKKMTSMPAQWLGRMDMGILAEGMRADVAVFDPDVIEDRATYTDPHQYSVGICDLLVNGVPVILDGGITGEKPGRWIRGPVRRPAS
ncbi:MAG: D-aminoacylase [Gemmatimonadetes bacterium]|nr:D-aminoacylase [Gemmatimonadota bacterium]